MVARILAGARAGAADLIFVRCFSPYPVVLSIVPVDGKSALFGRNSFFNVLEVFFNLANLRVHVTHQIVVGHPEIICKNAVFSQTRCASCSRGR
jgi:hypothetical protein